MANTGAIRAGKAYVELGTDNKNLEKGLKSAQRRLREFGSAVRAAGTWLFAAGAGILGSLGYAAKTFANYGDSVAKMAKRTGLSTEALSELQFVASQSGTEFESLENAFRRMQRGIYDAGMGMKSATDALGLLGLSAADLQGLAPEDQFALLADRMGRVADATQQAALAQVLFGRSGTNLIPMFELGAAGIRKLRLEAQRAGLTMSTDDARAAEAFNDALDKLWKTLRMAAFQVGGALAPALQQMAGDLTVTIAAVTKFVKQNAGLVIVVAKAGIVLAAAGIALIAVGQAALFASSALGLLAVIAPVVSAVLAAVFAPHGLLAVGIIAAAVASMVAIFWLVGGFKYLGQAAQVLKSDATTAFDGIRDALMAGDIGLAAKILWLTLKLEWQRGIGLLKGLWATLKFYTLTVMANVVDGIRAAWQIGLHAIISEWYFYVGTLRDIWGELVSWFKKSHDAATSWIAKRMIDVQGVVGAYTDEEVAQMKAGIDAKTAAYAAGVDEQRKFDDAAWEAKVKQDDEAHKRRLAAIGEENIATLDALKVEQLATIGATDDEIAKARRELAEARRQAAEARRQMGIYPEGPTKPGPPPDISDIQDAIRNTISTIGAFQVESVLGLKAGSATDRIANGIDKIERNTRSLKDVDELAFT